MSSWLSKAERKKRDDKVVELYNQGLALSIISQRCGLCAGGGAVTHILVKRGITRNRLLSVEEREERDKKVIEAYYSGVLRSEILLRFETCVSDVLKRHGLTANRRGVR